MDISSIRKKLINNNLKVTPQRVAVLEAIIILANHPTAENIRQFLKKKHPHIAMGTIYNVLEVLVEKGIIKKVKTDKDIMRYDALTEHHHHLYCIESDRIEDYFDEDLNNAIVEFFKQKNIPNFKIDDIKLQIIGKFSDR